MLKISDTMYPCLKLSAILVAAVVATGCVSAKSKTAISATASYSAPATSATSSADGESTSWLVISGDTLWDIAGVDDVYNMPEQWPLLFKSNLDQIEDADLIYPGQVLAVPRDSSQSEINAAINHARSRGAWSMGDIEYSDSQYRNQ